MFRLVRRRAALAGLVLVASFWSGACMHDSHDSHDTPTAAPAACNGVELIVAASDYSESMVCGAPRCERGPSTVGVDLGKDPQLASSNGRAFYLARDNDRIYELDPACGTATAKYTIEIEGARGLTNPHDVAAAADGSLFVTLFNVPRVAIMKDGKVDGTIDTSSYDADGNPQADAVRIVDVGGVPKAFVSLEVLDDNDPTRPLSSNRPSLMLRIDVASRKVEASIELAGRNPFNTMAEQNGLLFLAEPGNFDSDTDDLAGIERFDTATSTTRLLVRERDLGGSVSEVAVTEGCGVAIVAGPAANVNPTALVTFDPVSGQVLTSARAPTLGPTPGYDLQGLAWRGNSLFVGDRRQGGGGYPVHVFDREPGTCILRPALRSIDLPLRPVALRPAR